MRHAAPAEQESGSIPYQTVKNANAIRKKYETYRAKGAGAGKNSVPKNVIRQYNTENVRNMPRRQGVRRKTFRIKQ